MRLSVFAALIFFHFNLPVFAGYPIVRNFTGSIYKSGAQNWAISQHESNIMYFANNSGLLEFDGKKWRTYPIANITKLRSVLCAPDGKIYVGASNELGYYQKLRNGQLSYHSLVGKIDENFRNFDNVWNIHRVGKTMYFQADRSIFRYEGDSIEHLPFDDKIDASAIVRDVFFVAGIQKGAFMLNGDFFIRVPGSEILTGKKIVAILPFKDSRILFVTNFHGVFVFDGISVLPHATGIDDFLKNNQVFSAATNGRQLVFGTVQRGIAVMDIEEGTTVYANSYLGLQNNTVLSLAFDRQQNLWLGLDKGIDYVLLNTSILNILGTNNLYGSGYASLLKDGKIYFGTNQGLYTASYPLLNVPEPLRLELVKRMEGQVWNLTEIDNTLFCGSDRGAFIVYSDRVERIPQLQGTWSFKQMSSCPDLILGCSYHGLFILKKTKNTWAFSHFLKGNFTETSPMFEENEDGSIWFSHWQKGMFRLYLNDKKDSIARVDLYGPGKGFPTSQNNTLYRIQNKIVFSSEYGFYLYNKQTDQMEPYEALNRMFVSPPNSIRLYESRKGDIWCVSGTFMGVIRRVSENSYEMDSLSYRILQPQIIIGFEHFNFIDRNSLIVSTENGFCRIDTKQKAVSECSFNTISLSVIVPNDKSGTSPDVNDGNTLFAKKQNSLRFDFVAPEYREEDIVQYSYMLENYDETWSDFNTDNLKEYTYLPKGDYVFKVKARSLFEAGESTCTYSFTILPAWYETRLAFVVYGIFVLMLVAGLIFFIDKRSRKKTMDMEKRKEFELEKQKKQYEEEMIAKKHEIKELKNQQLQYNLRHKSQELANSTMNLIRKNEILLEIMKEISSVHNDIKSRLDTRLILSRLSKMERDIKHNIENDDNWKRFEENFDLAYENFLKRLGEMYPELTVSDKKLCAYLKMDLSTKDIAPLLNMSIRSIETNRYRLRKKLGLGRNDNLSLFLQRF